MSKTVSSRPLIAARPVAATRAATASGRAQRRWLATGGVLVVLGASAFAAWRHWRGGWVPAPAAMALRPIEARLLTVARQEPANPQPYLQLAEEYAAGQRPASAFWAYTEAASRAPGDATIQLKRAAALKQLGYPAVAESLVRAVAGRRGSGTEQARRDLADLLLTTGHPAEAVAALGAPAPATEMWRGRACEALGDAAGAEKAYRSAGAAGDPEGYRRLARLELAGGHPGAARAALRSLNGAGAAQPGDLLLASAVEASGEAPGAVGAALQTLLRYVRLRPSDPEAYYQAGLLFLRQGNRQAARDQFDRAVQLDLHHAEARRHLADLLQAVGERAQAHWERAAYEELQDQPDRALAELRRAGAAGYPDDVERTLMAVRITSGLQQLPAAVETAEAGLKRHPGEPDLKTQLGLLYERGDARVALQRLCREWTARDPAAGTPYWLLGTLNIDQSHAGEGLALLRKACALEPNRANFCSSLGDAYLNLGTPDGLRQAQAWLAKAITIDPTLTEAYGYLGRALEETGDPEGARRAYLRALDLQPDQTGIYNNLLRVSLRLNRPQAASLFADLVRQEEARTRERERLDRAVRARPADGAARLELARLFIREGRLSAARHQLERAAEPGSAAPQARALLTQVDRWLRVQSE